jgi:hypothetical protein
LDHLPSIEDYCAGGMMKKRRAEFDIWHRENYNSKFDLKEVLKNNYTNFTCFILDNF